MLKPPNECELATDCVKVYRGDKQTAAQLRRYVSDSLERKLFPDVRVEGTGRVKTVVYDAGWTERKSKPHVPKAGALRPVLVR